MEQDALKVSLPHYIYICVCVYDFCLHLTVAKSAERSTGLTMNHSMNTLEK